MATNSNPTVNPSLSPDNALSPFSLPDFAPTISQHESSKVCQKVLTPGSDDSCDVSEDNSPPVPNAGLHSILLKRHHKGSSFPTSILHSQKSSSANMEIWQSMAQYTGGKISRKISTNFGDRSYSYANLDISSVLSLSFEQRARFFIDKYKTNASINKVSAEASEKTRCTFRPKLSHSRSECVNFASFLKTQHDFEEAKARKAELFLQEKYAKEREEITAVPKINPASTRMLVKKKADFKKTTVYTRLHSVENYRKKKMDILEQEKLQEAAHKPKIKKRSLNKSVHILTNRHLNEHTKVVNNTQKQINKKDLAHVSKKIDKELCKNFISLAHDPDGKLTFEQLCTLMQKCSMVSESTITSFEHTLLEKMWEMLKGDQKGGIALQPLSELMHDILKSNPAEEAIESHKTFYQFYLNKIAQKKEAPPEPRYSHRPSLNQTTVKLAGRSKERTKLELKGDKKAAVENLMEVITKQRVRDFDEYKLRLAEEKAKECTFRPKILNNKRVANNQGKDKFTALYDLSKRPKSRQKKASETSYETRPLTNRPKKVATGKLAKPLKGVDAAIERLTKGRKERECVELAKKMGITFAKAESLMELQAFKTEVPLQNLLHNRSKKVLSPSPQKRTSTEMRRPVLQVEIKVAEGCEKTCIVYEGQTAEEVTDNFARLHGLSAEAKAKIYSALKAELINFALE